MKDQHYQEKSIRYGISKTRLRKILEIAKDIKNKRILDIGCARGYLGAQLKRNENYVAGIEISISAVHEAEKVLNKVYIADIEKKWPEEIKQEKYDIVVLSEFLEHVFDPVEVLRNAREVLLPDGAVIITTPNFMTWTNRIKFMFGNFKYQEQGMFDFGHIRWFTYSYLKEVLSVSGFEITKENHIIFPGKLTKILKLWPSLFASQFILKARKI